ARADNGVKTIASSSRNRIAKRARSQPASHEICSVSRRSFGMLFRQHSNTAHCATSPPRHNDGLVERPSRPFVRPGRPDYLTVLRETNHYLSSGLIALNASAAAAPPAKLATR